MDKDLIKLIIKTNFAEAVKKYGLKKVKEVLKEMLSLDRKQRRASLNWERPSVSLPYI